MPAIHSALDAGTSFGRYRIASRLATGGMASVWLATLSGAEGFEKEVVVKTMLPELASSPELLQMFINEARIAARFNHPNIVQVFDFGCLDGHYYIVMEHVAGRSMRQIRRRLRATKKPFPRRLLLRTIVDVCRALGYAHDLEEPSGWLGFVHGDISPENVMVARGGMTKLIDFGAAHINALSRPAGKFIGKYRYVSPERLGGGVGDRRSDIYSLGVILYEFLTGVRPYEGEDHEIIAQVRAGKPRDAAEMVPDLPADLVAIIRKTMAVYPEDRYQTAEQLASELLRVLRDLSRTPAAPDEPRMDPGLEVPVEEAEPLEQAIVFEYGEHDSDELAMRGPLFSESRRPARTAHAVAGGVRWLPTLSQPRNDAARHFDRGFVLVAANRYQEALEEWELALAGDPENRDYQTNVRRLRAQVSPDADSET
jgi:serine/threonine protein kinase